MESTKILCIQLLSVRLCLPLELFVMMIIFVQLDLFTGLSQ
jgi:hypothetical protein